MKLEKRLDKVQERVAQSIQFYECRISPEALEECQVAEGTEHYVDMLIQKYKERLGR